MQAIPEHIRQRGVKLKRDGVPTAVIARRLGVSITTVNRWVRAAGEQTVRPEVPDPDTLLATVRRLGATRAAHQFGVARVTIYRWLEKATQHSKE